MSEDNDNAAPLYVWLLAVILVTCSAFALLLLMGSVDNLIQLVN